MKRIVWTCLAVMAAVSLLTGCGQKDVTYLKEIKNADKFVTLGQYKGLPAQAKKTEITDEYMERYLEFMVSQLATYEEVTGRPVEAGDVVSIDYAGYMDGEAFEGGTGSYDLEIGSHSFIDGFEDGLIGANVGDKLTLDLTFPEVYDNNPDLAGKPVKFDVTVNKISVEKRPELTDELVAGFGIPNCTTADGLRELLRQQFEADAESVYRQNVKQQLAKAVTDNAEILILPEKMAKRQYDMLEKKLVSDAKAADMELAQYLGMYYGLASEHYEDTIRENSDESTKQMLVFKAIADKEGITVSKMDIEDSMAADAESQGMTMEKYRSTLDEASYEEYVLSNKVLDYLIDQAVITEPAETEE